MGSIPITRSTISRDILMFAGPAHRRLARSPGPLVTGLLALRTPYPGRLGGVEPGALADLLLMDGNPLADLQLLADPARNLVVIVKDGKVYKNTLP